ncbi:sialoadhesin [Gastrophryne carolinensis]
MVAKNGSLSFLGSSKKCCNHVGETFVLMELIFSMGIYSDWLVNTPKELKSVPDSCVYIPCTFNYPSDIQILKGINKMWYKDYFGNQKVVYHSTKPPDSEFSQRVEFLGDSLPKNCTVLMKNLQKTDIGSYSFRFEIIDGNKWIDKIGVTLEITDAPLLPKVLFPFYIDEGASVTFQCSTPYFCPDGSVTLNWKGYTPERSVLSSDVRLDTTAVLMTQNLTTSFTWMENGKEITCAVSVGGKIAMKKITLNVTYPPKRVSVKIQPSGKNIKQGDSVTLTCNVNSSNPAVSSYIWYKDGAKISTEPFLMFHSIAKADHGEYRCEVQNTIGSTASETTRLLIFSADTVVSPSEEVREGELVTLTCDVPGVKPNEVQYSWYKNNVWIKEGSTRSLIFHKATRSDSGFYYCKVQNDLGSESSPPITLNILYPPQIPTLTSFLETQQGNMVMVHCTVDSNPFSELSLYKDDVLIASTTAHGAPNQRIQVTSLKNSLSLEIREVTLSDEGTYTCVAKNSISNSTASVQLTVEMVRVLVEPSMEVEEFKKVRLTCAATRHSEEGMVYTWFKNDRWLKEDTEGNVLTFQRVSPKEAGFYFCKARDKQGSSTSPPVTLHVLYSPRGLSLTSFVSSHDPLKAIILCSVDSAPPSQLFLFRKDKLVAPNLNIAADPRYTALLSTNSLQLEIQDVVMEDEGIYTCSANNTYGHTTGMLEFTTATAKVVVNPSADVQEGESVDLTCSFKSTSHAVNYTFSWYKNNALIMEGQGLVLQFAQITSSDSGSYYCKVRTSESSKTSAPLNLQVAYAPRNIQLKSFQDTRDGWSAFIRCSVDSYPEAAMELYREDKLVASGQNKDLSDERFTVSSSRNELTLSINNVRMEDEGKYNCSATNSIQSVSETLTFTILNARVLVSPSTEVLEGVRVTLTCDTIKPQLDGTEYIWYKNSGWLKKTNTNVLLFDSVRSSDTGYYHCLARHTQDSSTSPSVSLHVSYAPRKPTMSSFWEASGAQVGIIQCLVESDPPSTLALYFKDVMVGTSHSPAFFNPRMKTISTQNMIKLEISQVMLEDEGLYTCLAKNSMGESRAEVNFTAQTTQILVNPISPVQEGQAVNMTCKLSSEDLDGVRYIWYKNGNIYVSAMSNILSFPNITSEDRGSYFCSVQSHVGSKNSQSVSLDVLYPPRNVHLKSFLDTENGKVGIILGSVDSNPPSEMSLYKDGHMLVSSTHGSRTSARLHAYFFTDTLRVEIRNLKTDDQGTYIFVVKNIHGAAQSSVTLTVTGVRVLVSPDAEIQQGSSVTLTCDVLDSSEVVTAFTWYKNSRWFQEGTLGFLEFGNVSSSDAGSYSCTAHSSRASMSSPPISITVLYPPRNLLLTSYLELQERRLAIILCQVDSEPRSHIAVLRGKELINDGYDDSGHHVKLLSSHNTLRLEIQDISMDDQQEYTCQANNSLGWSQKSIHFSMQTAIVDASPSTKIPEGGSVTLTCQSPRTNNMTYTWYRNNKWLHTSSQKSLVLHKVSSSYTGSYHCLAEHQEGHSASPVVGINILYGPRNLELTSYLETHGRGQAMISCHVDSDPPSVITLTREDSQLCCSAITQTDRGGKYWSSTSYNYLRLEIRDITLEDFGSYFCTAKNMLGTARSSISLHTKVLTVDYYQPNTSVQIIKAARNQENLHPVNKESEWRLKNKALNQPLCVQVLQLLSWSFLHTDKADSAYKAIAWVAIVCVILLIAGIIGLLYWKRARDKLLLQRDEDSIEMCNKETAQVTETSPALGETEEQS